MQFRDEHEKQLWREVFVAFIRSSSSVVAVQRQDKRTGAADVADIAVEQYRERLPT